MLFTQSLGNISDVNEKKKTFPEFLICMPVIQQQTS